MPSSTFGAAAPPATYLDNPETGSILDYWSIICRRKLTLGLLAVVGVAIAVVATLPQAPMYQARTTLEIQDLNQDFMNLKFVNPIADTSSLNAMTDLQTQIKILQSNRLIVRALKKMQMAPPAAMFEDSSFLSWIPLLSRSASKKHKHDDDHIAEALAKHLKVDIAGQTRIVELLFDSPDPKFAAVFVNTLAAEFIDENIQARWEMTRHTSEWLVDQLEDLRVKLRASEDSLQSYARQKGLIYTGGDKQNISEEKLRQLQAELMRAQWDRVTRQSRFEITRSAKAETLPDVLNDSNLRTLQTNLTDLRRREAELGATFKSDYSKVKKIKAEIAALEAAIEQERSAIVSRIKNDFEEAQRREKLLAAAYAGQTRLVSEDSENAIQYNILKREVDTNRQVYEAMLQRVKESSIASAMRASNVRIIDPAKPPIDPYKPNMFINSAIGLLCGVMFGVVLVVTRERTDSSLHEPGDAGVLLGVPELGAIPNADAVVKAPSSVTHFLPGRDKVCDSVVVVSQSSPSMVADSFRALLT